MAREEVSRRGGFIAQIAVLAIMVILLGVIALVVVNALKSSPWATFTLAMTIPIAMLVGLYLRFLRPGRVMEASVIGVSLIIVRGDCRAMGGGLTRLGAGFYAQRSRAGLRADRVWICGVRAAGLVAARAP